MLILMFCFFLLIFSSIFFKLIIGIDLKPFEAPMASSHTQIIHTLIPSLALYDFYVLLNSYKDAALDSGKAAT